MIRQKSFWPCVFALFFTLLVFEYSNFDLALQHHFYDHGSQRWLVDAKAFWPRWLCYRGPKFALGIFAFFALLGCLWPRYLPSAVKRIDLLVVLLTLAIAPSLVALSKAKTNIYSPRDLVEFDGKYHYAKLLEPRPILLVHQRKGRSFPAGHASGGFALMSLVCLATTRRGKVIAFTIGVIAGSIMGAYQMLNGAHFLSHTIISALCCWLIFLIIQRVVARLARQGS